MRRNEILLCVIGDDANHFSLDCFFFVRSFCVCARAQQRPIDLDTHPSSVHIKCVCFCSANYRDDQIRLI